MSSCAATPASPRNNLLAGLEARRKPYVFRLKTNAYTWQALARFLAALTPQPATAPRRSIFSFDTGGGAQHSPQRLASGARYGPRHRRRLRCVRNSTSARSNGVNVSSGT